MTFNFNPLSLVESINAREENITGFHLFVGVLPLPDAKAVLQPRVPRQPAGLAEQAEALPVLVRTSLLLEPLLLELGDRRRRVGLLRLSEFCWFREKQRPSVKRLEENRQTKKVTTYLGSCSGSPKP